MHFLTMDSLRAEADYRRERLTRAWQQPALGTGFGRRLRAVLVRRAPTTVAVGSGCGLPSEGTP